MTFTPGPGGAFVTDIDVPDQLVRDGQGFRFFDARAAAFENFDSSGRLTSIQRADGRTLTFTYSNAGTASTIAPAPGYLINVQDSFGRSISFAYELPVGGVAATDGRVKTVTVPRGQIALSYTAANLTSIAWPDARIRQFRYERPGLPWAMTSVVDENGVMHASIGYDDSGRANSSALAGGVDGYAVSYSQPPTVDISSAYDAVNDIVIRTRSWRTPTGTSITLPNGATSSLGAAALNGLSKLTSQSQPAGSGCAASASTQTYDANGNTASRDDFNGNRVCYSHDLGRNVELVRVEGLAGGAPGTACSTVTGGGASLPTGARKVNTAWHPDWRLPTRVAEPGKLTTYVYNGQPDPFANGAAASCAPAAATLPGGKPIAVLCKQVEQATTDANGASGFSASTEQGVAARTTSMTYNQLGQMLTETDPTGNTTTYTYYTDTAFASSNPDAEGHTLGDLATVTSPPTASKPQGLTTSYNTYNRNGQVRSMTDPNGVATTYTYDARQRLTSVTAAGQTASYEYWPTGLLKKVTQPDSSFLSYGYDDAHRLTSITDNLGNSVTYTLDNLGNRTAEEFKDAGSVLRRSLGRSIDALGRVQQVTGRE